MHSSAEARVAILTMNRVVSLKPMSLPRSHNGQLMRDSTPHMTLLWKSNREIGSLYFDLVRPTFLRSRLLRPAPNSP